VTRRLPGGALDLLASEAEIAVWEHELPPAPDELVKRTVGSQGILTLLTDRVDAALLESSPGLLVISNMATGFDNIDVTAASARNILVTRTPGVLSGTTAEFTIGLMFAAARRIAEGDRQTRAGRWKTWGPEILLGRDLAGGTLGIIGMGGVGSEVARRAYSLGMNLVYYSRHRRISLERRYKMESVPLDDLLRRSDFVSLHAPLSTETRHLINERSLGLMKPTSVLVNTARGPLVDQAALYRALTMGIIAYAALDVTDPEPMAPDDPLLRLQNVLVTPHIASASVATRQRMAMLAAENLVTALKGRVPKHTVNREISNAWRERFPMRPPAA
jgi:lactate dehydrogenase-like 2-hydroxyacid dehydrogenase